MKKHSLIAKAIQNSVAIICWSMLAIIFNKWWITLFACLFFTSGKTTILHTRYCDFCGKKLPFVGGSSDETFNAARKAGWKRIKGAGGEWLDMCCECQKELKVDGN